MKLILSLFILSLFFSCSHKNERLEFALRQAGNNRSELEKVLAHYQGDSLKYRSAVFLMENMPYYAYEQSAGIDSIKQLLPQIFQKESWTEAERQKGIRWQRQGGRIIKRDIEEVKAAMLIENIDLAFEVWQNRAWNKHLPFTDFCELLLPYRIADEPLTNWRKKYYEKYSRILDSIYQGTDVIEACNALSAYMRTERFYYFTDFGTPRQGAEFQFENRIGTCRDACDIATYVMRSVGIPVTTDLYPLSPEYKWGHEWNVVRDTTGNYLPFWYEQFYAVRDTNFTDRRKKGKVFRMTYAAQQKPEKLSTLPQSLRNPFHKDVTAEYFGNNSVSIPLQKEAENVFIGIFDARRGWIPVGQGKIENGSAVFENIEPYVIYQPLTYQNDTLSQIAFPFMYKKDSVRIFSPSKEKERIAVSRKYPLRQNTTALYKKWLLHTQIKAATHHSRPYEILHEITELPRGNNFKINIKSKKKYRKFRYEVPKDTFLSIAEIHFFGNDGKEIVFDTIYTDGNSWQDITLYQLKNSYDNDPLSFFHTAEKGKSLFFETRTPQQISEIRLVPRNDDNYIRENDTYELFYNNGADGWVSLGKQTASHIEELYYDVPKNAVLWLKNTTRGREEQIFTHENNRQIFPTFHEYRK